MLLFIGCGKTIVFAKVTFQYISCCYLSMGLQVFSALEGSFNTSHVVIYQYPGKRRKEDEMGFNTSHVVIYPVNVFNGTTAQFVSIHLMLLFILLESAWWIMNLAVFQYISCCYLSDKSQNPKGLWYLFQYISCCYLSLSSAICTPVSNVSIHLMLLFILLESAARKSWA